MDTMRHKLPTTRYGETHTIQLGKVVIELTVNVDGDGVVRELFGKASDGYTAHVEDICIPSSLALQFGCSVAVLAKQLRFRNYPPHGNIGEARSLSDAIARVLEEYIEEKE